MADKRWGGKDVSTYTYEDGVNYILDIPKFAKTKTSHKDLQDFLRNLGNPEETFAVIHVAGTNGKGSVCAYLTSVLKEAGIRVGTFTSPHLEFINERFQINGEPVSNELFLETFKKVFGLAEAMVAEGYHFPTFFEFLFLMGMSLFQTANVQYVILETGLGGRLDATNAIKQPVVSVITSIGFDHTAILGERIEDIAFEKAGIIKAGIPVVYDGSRLEVQAVIEKQAYEKQAPCFKITNSMSMFVKRANNYTVFKTNYREDKDSFFEIPFLPNYQITNALLALKTLELLENQQIFSKKVVQAGLSKTLWPGRMEMISEGVYLDGAHNPSAIEAFIETANAMTAGFEGAVYLFFSVLLEKDFEKMMALLATKMRFDQLGLIALESSKGLSLTEMAEKFQQVTDKPLVLYQNTSDACDALLKLKSGNVKVFCVGSLYMVGEIKTLLRRKYHD